MNNATIQTAERVDAVYLGAAAFYASRATRRLDGGDATLAADAQARMFGAFDAIVRLAGLPDMFERAWFAAEGGEDEGAMHARTRDAIYALVAPCAVAIGRKVCGA